MNKFLIQKVKIFSLCIGILIIAPNLYAKTISQFTPTLTITENYTDNYYNTEIDTTEQFTTIYQLGFSLGFLEKRHQLYLGYDPKYKDYSSIDVNDGLDHAISINGNLTPSKTSSIAYGGNIEITQTDRVGESSRSNIFFNANTNLLKRTELHLSEEYSRSFDEQITTGNYNTSDTNNTSLGISNQFGEKDKVGLNYTFSFTEYEDPSSDDFRSHKPSLFLTNWFTPLYGFDSNISYQAIEYDLDNNQTNTISGDIKFIKKMTKHLDTYLKYAQTYADQTNDVHSTYHPSIGFDWKPDIDSGISLGGGVIFQEYENQTNYEKEKFFVDLDMHRNFNFSRRGTFSVTGSSGYGELDTAAASLGYNIYYQAGGNLTFKVTKRLNSDISVSYKLNQYDEPVISREDNTINFRAALNWNPLKWLQLRLSYTFTDFQTDVDTRNDYQENKGMISIRLIPTKPIILESSQDRETLQTKVY